MGFWWLLGFSQVARRLGDHFATTVAHLSPICVLSVAIVFLPFRFSRIRDTMGRLAYCLYGFTYAR